MRVGHITPNGVTLQKHEKVTINFLTHLGYDIELIPKDNRQGVRTPDINVSMNSKESFIFQKLFNNSKLLQNKKSSLTSKSNLIY